MKKIMLDFRGCRSQEELQDCLMQALELPDWYGKNLDALYDCLCSIAEPTCIGILNDAVAGTQDKGGAQEELSGRQDKTGGREDAPWMAEYIRRVKRVFGDAEDENENLCVFFDVGEGNGR